MSAMRFWVANVPKCVADVTVQLGRANTCKYLSSLTKPNKWCAVRGNNPNGESNTHANCYLGDSSSLSYHSYSSLLDEEWDAGHNTMR